MVVVDRLVRCCHNKNSRFCNTTLRLSVPIHSTAQRHHMTLLCQSAMVAKIMKMLMQWCDGMSAMLRYKRVKLLVCMMCVCRVCVCVQCVCVCVCVLHGSHGLNSNSCPFGGVVGVFVLVLLISSTTWNNKNYSRCG